MVTYTDLSLATLVTLTTVPKGRVRWAAAIPARSYPVARPTCRPSDATSAPGGGADGTSRGAARFTPRVTTRGRAFVSTISRRRARSRIVPSETVARYTRSVRPSRPGLLTISLP